MIEKKKIGFIGAGNMAEAIIKGLMTTYKNLDLAVSDTSVERLEVMRTKYNVQAVSKDNAKIIDFADVILLAVKPQVIDSVLAQLKGKVHGKIIASIAAGISTAHIAEIVGKDAKIVRVMPNTPALVLSGAAAVCGGGAAEHDDIILVKEMLDAVGSCIVVDESKMDAVTGLSGSGPAYVYQFIEALSDGGVKMGLTRADATMLAAKTVMGAAKMVLETGKHPAELKDGVTSPGGTTICGVHEMEKGGVRSAVINAVEAGTLKSKELGQKK